MFQFVEALAFDDVLLSPKHSALSSRALVNTSVELGPFKLKHPWIPANMATVMNEAMIREVLDSGGLAIMHRFCDLGHLIELAKTFANDPNLVFSLGVNDRDKYIATQLFGLGASAFCIDIAHGDSQLCVDMIAFLKCNMPGCRVIAGNVATATGAERLWSAGAHVVKVGVGPGSLCTTRIETGNGVPQFHALLEISTVRKGRPLIADGGLKSAGDAVKALCFSDAVMAGNLFAGCSETPGTKTFVKGQYYKAYNGSSTHKVGHVEGIEAMVPIVGPFKKTLDGLMDGVKSGCSYQGVDTIKGLQVSPQFVKVTSAGLRESKPHDVFVFND